MSGFLPGHIFQIVKAMVFPVVTYRCESWTVKKAECQRIDSFELWCWRRLLNVPWTATRSNQSIQRQSTLNIHWKNWHWSWSSSTVCVCVCVCVSWSVESNSLQPHGQSMEFSRQEYWSGLPFPSLRDSPDTGIKLGYPALKVASLPSKLAG